MSVEKINQIYKCNVCGNIIGVLNVGGGTLVCCGQDMELLAEKTEDAGKEKHVPVIKNIDRGIKVKIGSIEHPMEEKHYIQWIEVLDTEKSGFNSKIKNTDFSVCQELQTPGVKTPSSLHKAISYRKFLNPGMKPEAEFCAEGKIVARAYCNIHGLWIK